jgi:hypothetical protein
MCHVKIIIKKDDHLWASIVIIEILSLLPLENKWLEAMVGMLKVDFFILPCPNMFNFNLKPYYKANFNWLLLLNLYVLKSILNKWFFHQNHLLLYLLIFLDQMTTNFAIMNLTVLYLILTFFPSIFIKFSYWCGTYQCKMKFWWRWTET